MSTTTYSVVVQYRGMDPAVDRAVEDAVELEPTSRMIDFERTQLRFITWVLEGDQLLSEVLDPLNQLWEARRTEWEDIGFKVIARKVTPGG